MLLDDALRGVPLVERFDGPIVDVGSGGGSPGIPLAVAFPDREVTLLEAERRKCDFLEQWAPPNARVVWGRAEEQAVETLRRRACEGARAAADRGRVVPAARPPGRRRGPVARPERPISRRSRRVRSSSAEASRRTTTASSCPEVAPTPPGFPRRVGVAKKRPLA